VTLNFNDDDDETTFFINTCKFNKVTFYIIMQDLKVSFIVHNVTTFIDPSNSY